MEEDTYSTVLTSAAFNFAGLPFDVVKLRLQTQGSMGTYNGVMNTMRRIAKVEGLPSLGKGGVPGLTHLLLLDPLFNGASSAVHKAAVKLRLQESTGIADMYMKVAETGIAQCIASTALVVPENIKSKLQFQRERVGRGAYRGMVDCAAKVVKREGVKGLFTGYSATLLRDIPLGIFAVEAVSMVTQATEADDEDALERLGWALAISMGGILPTIAAVYPADVIRTHMQTASAGNRLSLRDTARMIYRQQHIWGFYRGLGAASLGATMAAAAVLAVCVATDSDTDES